MSEVPKKSISAVAEEMERAQREMDIFRHFSSEIHVITREEAASVGIYPSIPSGPEPYPWFREVSRDNPMYAQLDKAGMLREMNNTAKEPEPKTTNFALGHECRTRFLYQNGCDLSAVEASNVLLRLDYAPVLSFFLECGLDRISYGEFREKTGHVNGAGFFFTFKKGAEALCYLLPADTPSRWVILPAKSVNHILTSGHYSPKTLLDPFGLATAPPIACSGCGDPSCPACWPTSSPKGVKTLNCPRCSSVVESADRYCRNCAYDLSQKQQGVPFPGPYGNVHPTPGPSASSTDYQIAMRCPGGCGSEINFDAATLWGAQNYFNSPCKYSCKVRVELWNKKVAEAKRSR